MIVISEQSRQTETARLSKILLPMLDKLLDEQAERSVVIDQNSTLYINGTECGNSMYMCQFCIDDKLRLQFKYNVGVGEKALKAIRIIDFGNGKDEPRNKIWRIYEATWKNDEQSQTECIYERYNRGRLLI